MWLRLPSSTPARRVSDMLGGLDIYLTSLFCFPPPFCVTLERTFFFACSYDTVALGIILSFMNAALLGLAAFQVRTHKKTALVFSPVGDNSRDSIQYIVRWLYPVLLKSWFNPVLLTIIRSGILPGIPLFHRVDSVVLSLRCWNETVSRFLTVLYQAPGSVGYRTISGPVRYRLNEKYMLDTISIVGTSKFSFSVSIKRHEGVRGWRTKHVRCYHKSKVWYFDVSKVWYFDTVCNTNATISKLPCVLKWN